MSFIRTVILAMSLLLTSAYSDFIQSPIPPSFNKNTFQDTNEDGKMDRLSIHFLGEITETYLHEMVDSLVFDWINSHSRHQSYTVASTDLKIDSLNSRVVYFDLPDTFSIQSFLTSLHDYRYGEYAIAKLYQNNGEVFKISMKDAMPPVLKKSFLKSHRKNGNDTLSLYFSEPVSIKPECHFIVEYKNNRDSAVYDFLHAEILPSLDPSVLVLVKDSSFQSKRNLQPRDSIRILKSCVIDESKNPIETKAFHFLEGTYPFEIYTVKSASYIASNQRPQTIFSLEFLDLNAAFPNDTALGVAIDIGGPEFESMLKEEALLKHSKPVLDYQASQLKIDLKLSIFTNLGAYVASYSHSLLGSDARFNKSGTRLFLRWNHQSEAGRLVQTGVYLADIDLRLSYDGDIIYQSQKNEKHIEAWGLLRR